MNDGFVIVLSVTICATLSDFTATHRYKNNILVTTSNKQHDNAQSQLILQIAVTLLLLLQRHVYAK